MLVSKNSIERDFIGLINDCELNQFLYHSTCKHGNTFDLSFSCADNFPFFSVHKAIIFQKELSSENFFKFAYAKSWFNIQILNNSLTEFFWIQNRILIASIVRLNTTLNKTLSKSLLIKLKKSDSVPYFYSSHTRHRLHRRETLSRKF